MQAGVSGRAPGDQPGEQPQQARAGNHRASLGTLSGHAQNLPWSKPTMLKANICCLPFEDKLMNASARALFKIPVNVAIVVVINKYSCYLALAKFELCTQFLAIFYPCMCLGV